MSNWPYSGTDKTWAKNFKQPTIEEAISIDKDFWGDPENHVERSLVLFGPGDFQSLVGHEAIADIEEKELNEFMELMSYHEYKVFGELALDPKVAGFIFIALINDEGELYFRDESPHGLFLSWQSNIETRGEIVFDTDISFVEFRAIIALWARHRGIIDADDLVREMQAILRETDQIYRFFKSFRPDTISHWGSVEAW